MNLDKTIKKLNNLGFDVHQEGSIYYALSDKYKKKISFMKDYNPNGIDTVCCIRVISKQADDSVLEGYHNGNFVGNITQAIKQAEPF